MAHIKREAIGAIFVFLPISLFFCLLVRGVGCQNGCGGMAFAKKSKNEIVARAQSLLCDGIGVAWGASEECSKSEPEMIKTRAVSINSCQKNDRNLNGGLPPRLLCVLYHSVKVFRKVRSHMFRKYMHCGFKYLSIRADQTPMPSGASFSSSHAEIITIW